MAIQQIYSEVTDRYSLASRGVPEHYGRSVAKAFGYSEEELASIPKEANLGLSCGNPIAIASIKEVSLKHFCWKDSWAKPGRVRQSWISAVVLVSMRFWRPAELDLPAKLLGLT